MLKDLGLKFPAKAHRRLFGNLARNGKRCSIASPHDIVLIKSQSEWQIPGRIGRKIILCQKFVFHSKPNLEVFPHDFKKFISIGTKDGKLNPATAVMSAFALRLHTNLPASQFVSNEEMWHSNHYEAGYF